MGLGGVDPIPASMIRAQKSPRSRPHGRAESLPPTGAGDRSCGRRRGPDRRSRPIASRPEYRGHRPRPRRTPVMPVTSHRSIGPGRILLIAAVNLVGLGSLTAPAVAGVPVKSADMLPAGERAAALAAVLALGAISALILNPGFAALSARPPGRHGPPPPMILGAPPF